MRTALTVITTAVLTAIAFLRAWQQGWLGNVAGGITTYPTPDTNTACITIEDGVSCTTPRGSTVAHGEALLSFKEETASEDTSCVSMTSICNDGSWLEDKVPYTYASCAIEADTSTMQPCLVDGYLVPHDSTNIFYRETTTNDGYIYATQERYCFDGEMDGDSSYNKLNLINGCNIETTPIDVDEEEGNDTNTIPSEINEETNTNTTNTTVTASSGPIYARCDGPFGGIWEHGRTANVYLQSSVAYGQSCVTTPIVCGYGSIRTGSNPDAGTPLTQTVYNECLVNDPIGCSTACGDIDHGATVTTYSAATVPYNSDETCSDIKITSTCNNGSLSPAGGSACSCTVADPASCTAPNGQLVLHNASLTLYQYPQVQAVAGDGSDTCVRQRRTCNDGTWYDYDGNAAGFTFEYPTCTVLPPPEGDGEGGEGQPQE